MYKQLAIPNITLNPSSIPFNDISLNQEVGLKGKWKTSKLTLELRVGLKSKLTYNIKTYITLESEFDIKTHIRMESEFDIEAQIRTVSGFSIKSHNRTENGFNAYKAHIMMESGFGIKAHNRTVSGFNTYIAHITMESEFQTSNQKGDSVCFDSVQPLCFVFEYFYVMLPTLDVYFSVSLILTVVLSNKMSANNNTVV